MSQIRRRLVLAAASTALGAASLRFSRPLQAQPSSDGERSVIAQATPSSRETATVRWQIFESASGKFKVVFPGAPIRKQTRVRTEIGDVVSTRHSAGDGAGTTYDVTYDDYAKAGIARLSPAKLLNAVRDGFVHKAKGRLVSEKPFTVDGIPGSELEILANNGMWYRTRLLLVENRLYQLTAIVRPPTRSDEQKFFDSFQLTGLIQP